jgi:hypothetical protein
MPAGYSKKSLLDKLGIKSGFKIFVSHEPESYWKEVGKLPTSVVASKRLSPSLNFIHYFTTEKSDLKKIFPQFKKNLLSDGILWISWPKGSSKVITDLNDHVVREVGLVNGLVDIKVCAVDEVWSGLKFVYRLKDR